MPVCPRAGGLAQAGRRSCLASPSRWMGKESNRFRPSSVCHIYRTTNPFHELDLFAALQTHSKVHPPCAVWGDNAWQLVAFFFLKEKYREEISDCSGCNARHGDRRRRRRPPPPTARLSAGSHRQDAHRQGPDRERPDWQGSGTGHFEILNPGLLKPTFNRPAVKGRRT